MIIHHIIQHLGIGGVERLVFDLSKAQASAGHSLCIVTLSSPHSSPAGTRLDSRRRSELKNSGVQIWDLKGGARSLVGNTLKYRHFLRTATNRPDVVHAHAPVAAMVAMAARVGPVHLTMHSSEFALGVMPLRQLVRRVDSVSAGSRRLADKLSGELGVSIADFRYGLETGAHVKSTGVAKDGVVRLLFVGRMESQKNPCLLIHALGHLRAQSGDALENVEVRLVGDGALLPDIRSLVGSLRLGDRVTIVGSDDELDHHFGWADYLVMTSNYEGVPLVLLEALAWEIPILATPFTAALEMESRGVGVSTSHEFTAASFAKLITTAMARQRLARWRNREPTPLGVVPSVQDMAHDLYAIYGETVRGHARTMS